MKRSTMIMVMVAALAAGMAGARGVVSPVVAADQPSGTITISDHASYSNVSTGDTETSRTSCTATIIARPDGSATATIAYSYHALSDQTSNGYESKTTTVIEGSGTVTYASDLSINASPDGTYTFSFTEPSIAASRTYTTEQTGQQTTTSQVTISGVSCAISYGLLKGTLGRGSPLRGKAMENDYAGADGREHGSIVVTWSLVDPNLQSSSPSPAPTAGPSGHGQAPSCTRQTAPAARAMGPAANRAARAFQRCPGSWYGTITLHSRRQYQVQTSNNEGTATWRVSLACDQTLTYRPGDRVQTGGTIQGTITIVDRTNSYPSRKTIFYLMGMNTVTTGRGRVVVSALGRGYQVQYTPLMFPIGYAIKRAGPYFVAAHLCARPYLEGNGYTPSATRLDGSTGTIPLTDDAIDQQVFARMYHTLFPDAPLYHFTAARQMLGSAAAEWRLSRAIRVGSPRM